MNGTILILAAKFGSDNSVIRTTLVMSLGSGLSKEKKNAPPLTSMRQTANSMVPRCGGIEGGEDGENENGAAWTCAEKGQTNQAESSLDGRTPPRAIDKIGRNRLMSLKPGKKDGWRESEAPIIALERVHGWEGSLWMTVRRSESTAGELSHRTAGLPRQRRDEMVAEVVRWRKVEWNTSPRRLFRLAAVRKGAHEASLGYEIRRLRKKTWAVRLIALRYRAQPKQVVLSFKEHDPVSPDRLSTSKEKARAGAQIIDKSPFYKREGKRDGSNSNGKSTTVALCQERNLFFFARAQMNENNHGSVLHFPPWSFGWCCSPVQRTEDPPPATK
ncbi:hypothetical protein ARMSODRAFT_979389 [Armillaria solidipes]|uniref:Uncharacterized protein n=1 Tax=Armillaria solidipes TaxID=1076256 RepID=A0A2H3B553_9AGAR|nr:hypothetical protein ARMSODRAFT_979389 [Armillaria solidipes]